MSRSVFYLWRLLLASLILAVGGGCSSLSGDAEGPFDPMAEGEGIVAGQENAGAPGKKNLSIASGLVYIRRQTDSELVEMAVVIGGDDETDLIVDLAPPRGQRQEDERMPAVGEEAIKKMRSGGDGDLVGRRNNDFLVAQGMFLDGNYTSALHRINSTLGGRKDFALGWALKGSIHYRLNQYKPARHAWKRALELDPSIARVRELLNQIGPE